MSKNSRQKKKAKRDVKRKRLRHEYRKQQVSKSKKDNIIKEQIRERRENDADQKKKLNELAMKTSLKSTGTGAKAAELFSKIADRNPNFSSQKSAPNESSV